MMAKKLQKSLSVIECLQLAEQQLQKAPTNAQTEVWKNIQTSLYVRPAKSN